ncbi:Rft-1-domain-containing protein [Tothia fuscella]|uniref:Man(5)GlcNAc(2)-PP-dolichol translocation protein RFT1 n=1 Tax=Tothia fuscella TaxID=1048955 RepID=A0A9P4P3N4_9PEZI|nr:Rft-1-domain-containing protein [Tothia fuscella]
MSALAASAKGATFLIALQLSSRLLTFLINQILLRYLSPTLLGLSTQLELYSITVLYFSRESIRVAVQRQSHSTQPVVNLSYISILSGIPLSYILAKLYAARGAGAELIRAEVPFFGESVGVSGLAAVIELFAEPGFVSAQQRLLYKVRATSEAGATVVRCFVTCGAAVWASRTGRDLGVLPFALGQLAYASFLLKLYVLQMWFVNGQGEFSLLPKRLRDGNNEKYILGYFSTSLTKLSISLFIQNSFKYILTQGDGLLIAALTSLQDQGAYALASNYGGLIARMLFQPIEESSRNMFAKVCSPDPTTKEASKTGIREAKSLLQNILRLYSLISLVACVLGPTLAPLLLRLVAGSKWADGEASVVLSRYCYYIPLLAINGVTEAFVAAVATNAELRTQSLLMGAFFAGFAGAAYIFLGILKMGAVGLVYANCVNMALRVLYNTGFIRGYFDAHEQPIGFRSVLPSSLSIATSIGVAGVLYSPVPTVVPSSFLGHLAWVGTISGVLGLLLLFFEREYIMHCYRMVWPVKTNTKRK